MPAPATTQLWDDILGTVVAPGTVSLWWLYQSGLVVKSPGGTLVCIDPYLSDAVLRSYQQARTVPALIDPAVAALDALVASHAHEDHLDPDSISGFMSHERARFIGPPLAVAKVVSKGVAAERTTPVRRGDIVEVGDLRVRAVYARHPFEPEPAPDAVGYVVEHDGVSVYHSGDTQYDNEIVVDTMRTSASLIAINGTAGNMNAHEAAMLAWQQKTHLAVPFHYGLWSDEGYGEGATLDPAIFVETYHRLDPQGRTFVLTAGKEVVIGVGGLVRG
jgi:L-ascorbate 6-phosphate lactonase